MDASSKNPKKKTLQALVIDRTPPRFSCLVENAAGKIDESMFANVPPESPVVNHRRSSAPSSLESTDDESTNVLRAITLLHRLATECEKNPSGSFTTSINQSEVQELLKGFATIFSPENSMYTQEVERALRRNFESQPNVFDDSVKSYIYQNFSNKGEKSNLMRALRRTSLVRRYISQFAHKPGTSPPPSPNKGSAAVSSIFQSLDLPPSHLSTLHEKMAHLNEWEFNLFEISEIVPDKSLLLVGAVILEQHEILQNFDIHPKVLRNFLLSVEAEYLKNPYHNSEHATDVAVGMNYLLTMGGLQKHFDAESTFAAIIAALVHDVAHPATSNTFLIAQDDPIAVRYSYRSPLENMHCAVAFNLLLLPKSNIMSNLKKVSQAKIRTLMVDMILATDNAAHSLYLGRFEGKVGIKTTQGIGLDLSDEEDQRLVLQIALHAADVSNPAKPFSIYQVWTDRIMEEFYAQGDRERELFLPVSVGYDRQNPIPQEKFQAGFIIGIVKPVFLALSKIPGLHVDECLSNLDSNLEHWQQLIAQSKAAEEEEERAAEAEIDAMGKAEDVLVEVEDSSIRRASHATTTEAI